MDTQGTSPAIERRRHARTQLQMTLKGIRLDPDGGDPVETLHMTDISRGGMGCYADRPFYPGQRIVLCLPLSGQQGRRNVYATVVRCRQGDDGYRVGLEFDNASVGTRYGAAAVAAA
jgi:hypothetical protein